jgi:hypothetical protein
LVNKLIGTGVAFREPVGVSVGGREGLKEYMRDILEHYACQATASPHASAANASGFLPHSLNCWLNNSNVARSVKPASSNCAENDELRTKLARNAAFWPVSSGVFVQQS